MPRRNIYIIIVFSILCVFVHARTSLPERIFLTVLRTVENKALEETDRRTLLEGALDGMIKTSPYYPYSAYLPPDEEPAYEDEIQGIFAGIGIYRMALDRESGELWFTPVANSPARQAGLAMGDRIVAADGKPLKGLAVSKIVALLRGPEGTAVRLTVRPRNKIIANFHSAADLKEEAAKEADAKEADVKENGVKETDAKETDAEETDAKEAGGDEAVVKGGITSEIGSETDLREVEIVRGMIHQEIILGDRRREDGTWDFTLENHPKIGYIRIDQFTDATDAQFTDALDELKSKKVRSLILDLRGNPGGFLLGAFNVCNHFLPTGTEIVTTQTRSGKVRGRLTATEGEKIDWPMVVLIDYNSASASEIVAGALADHNRATLIGTRSYGKGTVQELFSLPCHMGLLRLTDASFCRPSGKPIHRKRGDGLSDVWGITPSSGFDIPLSPSQETAVALFRDLRSFPPLPSSEREGLEKILFARAAGADLFSGLNDAEEGLEEADSENSEETDSKKQGSDSDQTPTPDREENAAPQRITGNPPYYDPQLDRAIEFLSKKSGANGAANGGVNGGANGGANDNANGEGNDVTNGGVNGGGVEEMSK